MEKNCKKNHRYNVRLPVVGRYIGPGPGRHTVYNRGLDSALAYKKIEYFIRATQLNP